MTENGLNAYIRKLPKPELHRHIEGCVRPGTVLDIALRRGLDIPSTDPAELEHMYRIYERGESLDGILSRFGLAQNSFQTYEDVERITYEACEDAYRKENVRLLELRFSPDFMLGNRLDWQKSFDIINSVICSFEKKYPVLCGLIIIFSRSYGIKSAEKTADFAVENRKNIIGFDLADSENLYPPALYVKIIGRIHAAGIPLTVHSGEEGGWQNMADTIRLLKPARIGHGIKAAGDSSGSVVDAVKRNGILLETNPWSNYLTRAVDSIEAHPLAEFLRSGIKCSIGADDPEILNTDLNREYSLAVEKIGLTLQEIDLCRAFAAESCFLPEDKKQQAFIELGLNRTGIL